MSVMPTAWSSKQLESDATHSIEKFLKVGNLEDAQKSGVSIFWSHNLDAMGAYIASTYGVDLEFYE